MADSQKAGKKNKNLARSGRDKNHNAMVRNDKVARARRNHLANALRSCGTKFADALRTFYLRNTPAPKKH